MSKKSRWRKEKRDAGKIPGTKPNEFSAVFPIEVDERGSFISYREERIIPEALYAALIEALGAEKVFLEPTRIRCIVPRVRFEAQAEQGTIVHREVDLQNRSSNSSFSGRFA
jgi:hypothetical protein